MFTKDKYAISDNLEYLTNIGHLRYEYLLIHSCHFEQWDTRFGDDEIICRQTLQIYYGRVVYYF